MKDFNNDVDFDYYVSEVEKLLIVANKPQSK
jgi:hypothetical protein